MFSNLSADFPINAGLVNSVAKCLSVSCPMKLPSIESLAVHFDEKRVAVTLMKIQIFPAGNLPPQPRRDL